MNIDLYEPMASRPCRFCLSLQDCCVFADFDVDDGLVYLVRISYDGFGCCHAPADIERMSSADSAALLAMVAAASLDDAGQLLRRYFRHTKDVLWPDALERHDLL
jgi:hypothetical protein